MCTILGRHRAGDEDQQPARILTAQAIGSVVHVGALAEVFGQGDRALLRVQRNERPAEELLLLRRGRRIFALVNRCPHMQRSLDDARVGVGVLSCPGHGRSYSLRTGRAVGTAARHGGPALRTARAWVDSAQLFLDIRGLGA